MIEQKQSGAVILQDGENIQETIKMSLDLDSAKDIMQILSKNLYSDAIGSTVREVCSNALDSHRAAGVTDRPIIVSFKRENNNYEFTVEDFGQGLDHNDVVDIISKYGKSTKKLSSIELGMYGLGWKAPLAYTSSFTFIVRKNGIERKYIMSEGEEENIIDLIDENSTDQPNGVKIIVPVSYYDANNFFTKIKEQLCYFESIYFDVSCNNGSIDNNFKITRYDDFQMSELTTDSNLHLCLDNVYYPLDFSKLGISPIAVPIGLRFGLSDGIYPVVNRESIRYTNEAKEIILKKIKTVASKLVEMYNKFIENTDDFRKIVQYYSNNGRYIDVGHKQNVEISSILKYSDVKIKEPHLKGISLLDLKKLAGQRDEIFSEYAVKYELSYSSRLRERKYNDYVKWWHFEDKYNIYKFSEKLGGVKKEYIKSISSKNAYFIKKIRERKLFSNKNDLFDNGKNISYNSLLSLHLHPKSEWRARIKEFQLIKESLEANIIDADALVIPAPWLANRKAQRVTIKIKKNGHQKLEGELSCKRAENLERYVDGKSCKFVPFSIDLKKIMSTNMFYIYTSHDNSLKLDRLYELSSNQTCKLITFSEREIKRVDTLDVHNLISYEKFMEGNNAIYKRLITAQLIDRLKSKYRHVFDNRDDIKTISTDLSNKLEKINNYDSKNYSHGVSDELFTAMLEVATTHDLFDYSIYLEYLEMKETLDRFPFLDIIYGEIRNNDTTRDRIIVDLLKYNKYKVNLDWYNKKSESELKEENDEIINN
jgi:anti-sigma regulatory factor (Ser/Thr protein kinase)